MWCSSCRADVAVELSTDNRRMLCARCQAELGIAASATTAVVNPPRAVETERDARELLARWSTQNLLEAIPSASSRSIPKPAGGQPGKLDGPQVRFDPPRTTIPAPAGSFVASFKDLHGSSPTGPIDSSNNPNTLDKSFATPFSRHQDQTTDNATAERRSATTPRGDFPALAHDPEQSQDRVVRDALQKQLNRRLGWSTLAGQLFAYGGVALLTCGTVLVMWSYFGGPPQYMPTGLLTAAVGQMLLFLGVVTLISSGMEQTVHEVSWRIDHLAEEIYHVGLALDDLEGSHRELRRHSAAANPLPEDGSVRRAA